MGTCFCTGRCRNGGTCPANPVPLPQQPPAMPGWRCPNCGAGLSPFTSSCPHCRPPLKITYGVGWPD